MKHQSSSFDVRFEVVTITYVATKEIAADDTVSIMGEYNHWLPEGMERLSNDASNKEEYNTFTYSTRLLKGFKYRFVFLVGEDIVHDET